MFNETVEMGAPACWGTNTSSSTQIPLPFEGFTTLLCQDCIGRIGESASRLWAPPGKKLI